MSADPRKTRRCEQIPLGALCCSITRTPHRITVAIIVKSFCRLSNGTLNLFIKQITLPISTDDCDCHCHTNWRVSHAVDGDGDASTSQRLGESKKQNKKKVNRDRLINRIAHHGHGHKGNEIEISFSSRPSVLVVARQKVCLSARRGQTRFQQRLLLSLAVELRSL